MALPSIKNGITFNKDWAYDKLCSPVALVLKDFCKHYRKQKITASSHAGKAIPCLSEKCHALL